MPSKTTLLVLAVSVWSALVPDSVQGAEPYVGEYLPERVFEQLPVDGAWRLTPHGSGFLVLDRFNHRLLELDASGSIAKQIGQVGQGPGELRFPMDYAVDDSGVIRIIQPAGIMAIHTFGSGGEFRGVVHQGSAVGEMAAWTSYSVAADSKGRFYLSQPRRGALVTRYSAGAELQASVGELLRPEQVFADCEESDRCRDPRFATRLNRVALAVDGRDAVVAAFTAAPVVRRYSSEGELEFEVRLRGGLVDELMSLALGDREAWVSHVTVEMQSDITVLTMLHGVSVDPVDGLVYCLVGGRELHVLSAVGERLAILRPAVDDVGFGSLSVVNGVVWLTGFSKMYRAELPPLELANNWRKE